MRAMRIIFEDKPGYINPTLFISAYYSNRAGLVSIRLSGLDRLINVRGTAEEVAKEWADAMAGKEG